MALQIFDNEGCSQIIKTSPNAPRSANLYVFQGRPQNTYQITPQFIININGGSVQQAFVAVPTPEAGQSVVDAGVVSYAVPDQFTGF